MTIEFKDKFIVPAYALAKGIGAQVTYTLHTRVFVRNRLITDRNFCVHAYFPPQMKKKIPNLGGKVTFYVDGRESRSAGLVEQWYPTISSGTMITRVLRQGFTYALTPGAKTTATICLTAAIKAGGGISPIMSSRCPEIDVSI